jgi:hypothetical protein
MLRCPFMKGVRGGFIPPCSTAGYPGLDMNPDKGSSSNNGSAVTTHPDSGARHAPPGHELCKSVTFLCKGEIRQDSPLGWGRLRYRFRQASAGQNGNLLFHVFIGKRSRNLRPRGQPETIFWLLPNERIFSVISSYIYIIFHL